MRVRVKVCGITSREDAEAAIEAGADYLGLNFYPGSPRCLDLAAAKEISRQVSNRCSVVAVVAGATTERVSQIVDVVRPDLVQFHGDESVEVIEPWAERALKVLRVRETPRRDQFAGFESVHGFLLDTHRGDLLGGTGRTWAWRSLDGLGIDKPIFVAGGLEPSNVRRAVEIIRPYAIDVCSGVETRPGRKSRRRLARLFEELRRAQPAS